MTPAINPLPPTRRRFIAISAAAMGLAAAPAFAAVPLYQWRGRALGAAAEISLRHPDPGAAKSAVSACVAEVARLEAEFSLYRPDSALTRLNRDGRLGAPSHDMVRLLSECGRYGMLTDGAFDATVQPLWQVYADYFRDADAGPDGPGDAAVASALARVDHRAVHVTPGRIWLKRPAMALTLNGIAQGYITDRVADLLRDRGFAQVLIDLGEMRALGGNGTRPWRVALMDPFTGAPGKTPLMLRDQAVATSAGYGTRFGAQDRFHHLFDPRTGRSTHRYASVSVIARTASQADALSTAIHGMALRPAARILALEEASAQVTLRGGRRIILRNS